MDFDEVQIFITSVVEKGFSVDEPRLRSVVIPQKGDSSKIYVVVFVDHIATDGLSLLNCFSLM